MTSGAGVSRKIWQDLKFSGQSQLLLEFLPHQIVVPYQIMVWSLLKPVPFYVIYQRVFLRILRFLIAYIYMQ